ncbi:IS3 family transposase [Aequorivita sp. 609]|uniref:IS3 family transposase n=1 Tax=Aequorivita TaxID=153265 RepID=UPI00161AAD25|nr:MULTISPECIES: IS3 family transposase [Aequorivita]MBB6682272.1 IS3 family transposase [Aequorivita sp. 609]
METIENNPIERSFSILAICKGFDLTRDAFYKYKKRYVKRIRIEYQVLKIVHKRRRTLPREGARKLMRSLKTDFERHNIKIGRDQLLRILRDNELLIRRKKYSSRTTNSHHRFYKYKNIIKDVVINRSNQVWAADITYIRTIKGFCYLALLTDMYSRKIVGFDLSDSLELTGCVRALKKAMYHNKGLTNLTHHSDRGIQYCSNVYTKELKRKKIAISMTEENHCYENALAERVNGILKDEFYLDQTFASVEEAKRATKNAIKLYNSKRLHLSLNYKTPNNVHKNAA